MPTRRRESDEHANSEDDFDVAFCIKDRAQNVLSFVGTSAHELQAHYLIHSVLVLLRRFFFRDERELSREISHSVIAVPTLNRDLASRAVASFFLQNTNCHIGTGIKKRSAAQK